MCLMLKADLVAPDSQGVVAQNDNFESVVSKTQKKKFHHKKKLVQNSAGYNTRSREKPVSVSF